ncbi:PH domain-containing protein [Actinokineospora terrae]|uniref:PH domain-containing protein n=1 Tax=Actinokineospora terrae TaxID=155974 RepID=A0A1H9XTD0_9PSEU|nr:PH domain-containing protein [Actinokineospora terrae]SES48977.1 PH domain-containing protein [Actinokineospora terrae]
MPVTPEDRSAQWAPEPRVVAVGWLLAAASALVAALVDDPRGALLLIAAAGLLGVFALLGTLRRPRLTADARGITLRGVRGSKQWSWGEVNVRLVHTRRLGRESSALELDADNAAEPDLVLLGRLDLGADPQDVVEHLLRLRT